MADSPLMRYREEKVPVVIRHGERSWSVWCNASDEDAITDCFGGGSPADLHELWLALDKIAVWDEDLGCCDEPAAAQIARAALNAAGTPDASLHGEPQTGRDELLQILKDAFPGQEDLIDTRAFEAAYDAWNKEDEAETPPDGD